MEYNFITHVNGCIESATQMMSGNLDLVYYSHIPVAIISIILGLFVIIKNKSARSSRSMFFLSIIFSFWIICNLMAWVSSNSLNIMFFWSLIGPLDFLICASCLFLLYTYESNEDVPFWLKSIVGVLFLPILIMIPTRFSVSAFDYTNCTAVDNLFGGYLYPAILVLVLITIIVAVRKYLKTPEADKNQILLMSLGTILFLASVFGTYYIADVFQKYSIEIYGVFIMTFFMTFIAFLIVRFKAFDIKLLGTQALVWALVILIGSQFAYFNQMATPALIIVGVSLLFSAIIGTLIIRGVKKEIKQRMEIEHLLKIKSEFIDIVSHQLRTPVSVIKGMASVLKEGDLDDAPKEQKDIFIAGIYEKSVKLADILNDILKAAELDMDNFSFSPNSLKPVNLSQIVKGIFDDLTSLAQEKKLNYQIKISPEITNLNIMTDESFLKNALQNIIDNGIKYSKGGSSLSVDLSREGNFFLCKVADGGIGIPAEQAERLFEKFFRAKNAVDTHAYGTGLGLFIAKKIFEAHPGGKIWFESVLDKGTTFYIKLPIAKQN